VRYRPILAIEQADKVSLFQEALGGSYEYLDSQRAQSVTVYFGPAGADPPPPGSAETIWRFRDSETGYLVALSSASLGFEASQYRDFAHFSAEFSRVLSVLKAIFSPSHRTRLGVRYVNEIEDDRLTQPSGLPLLITEHLVRPLGTELGFDVQSTLSDLRFIQPDGNFVLRHGLVRDNTYLLDFDYFKEEEVPFDPQDVRTLATSYHDTVEAVFVWSVTKEYLEELGTVTHV